MWKDITLKDKGNAEIHLLPIFKIFIYNARTTGYLNINHLLIYIKGIKNTEKKLCENDAETRKKFNKK